MAVIKNNQKQQQHGIEWRRKKCARRSSTDAPRPPTAAPVKVPPWVHRLVIEKRGSNPRFLMEKVLTCSDVDANQNRLLVPDVFVRDRVLRALHRPELDRFAGLVHDGNGTGLELRAYTKARWGGMMLKMARWPGSNACVLKGPDWKTYRKISGFAPGRKVQLWSFRTPVAGGDDAPSRLNVVIGDVTDPPADDDGEDEKEEEEDMAMPA